MGTMSDIENKQSEDVLVRRPFRGSTRENMRSNGYGDGKMWTVVVVICRAKEARIYEPSKK
jgi:hypothetical protein